MPNQAAIQPSIHQGANWIHFLKWAKRNRPGFYQALMAQAKQAPSLGANGDENNQSPWYERLLSRVVDTYAAYKTQRRQDKELELNLELARQGRAPVDMGDYGAAIRLQHELSLQNLYKEMESPNKSLLIGAGIIGTILLAAAMARGRASE